MDNKKLQDFEKCIPTMKSNQLRDLCTHVYKCKPTLFNKKNFILLIFQKMKAIESLEKFAKYFK